MRVEISQDTMRAIERYKQLHPEVWIKRPDQTASRRWEVSLPRTSAMAFDNPTDMMTTLLLLVVPADE